MENESSVLSVKNYGQLQFKLKQQLEVRNITRNYLARQVNTRFEVIDKWCRGDIEKIDADILARICFVLGCKVEDIIEYIP